MHTPQKRKFNPYNQLILLLIFFVKTFKDEKNYE
jgi:hypothetical protein